MLSNRSFYVVAFLVFAGMILSVLAVPASPALSASGTYVKTYANILNNVQHDVTPQDVSTTSDGGSIVLAQTQSSSSVGVSWLIRLDSSGSPRWQTELGCFGVPPGGYADGLSVQQTADGGYIVGGGTIGCGSKSACPPSSGIQCALVEKLDQGGKLIWAYVYPAGAAASGINQIRQTTDGGYIAVGSTTNVSQNTGALIVKLDSRGRVLWQRDLGPAGSTQAFLNAVQQTADGGYVATGEFYSPSGGLPQTSVLAVKLDGSGNLQWQRGFNNLSSTGAPNSVEHAQSILATSDGGYLVAGNWSNSKIQGECCSGALLLKLDANGNSQWQKAYSGGVYCYFNGFSETCTAIGGVIYSVHGTADGGYTLAGDGNLELGDSAPLVPWIAKVDSSGKLLWQHFYYQVYKSTGRPLSEYFASSSPTKDGGLLSVGWTENYATLKGELYAVKTDSAGLVQACSDVNTATPLNAINPGLVPLSPSLPVHTTITPGSTSPSTTSTTSIGVRNEC